MSVALHFEQALELRMPSPRKSVADLDYAMTKELLNEPFRGPIMP
jgi:hypothetical protein